MSEQTGPDGTNPVQPPRFGEVPTGPPPDGAAPPPHAAPQGEQTGPPTEPRPAQPAPPGPPPPGSQPPPSGDQTVHIPGSNQPPPAQPPGPPPNFGGPPSGGGTGGPPPGSPGGDSKKKGTVITLLAALGVVIAGTIAFVITRPDNNEPPSTNGTASEVTTTEPGTTLPETTTTGSTPDSTTTTTTTTMPASASGSVDDVTVQLDARAEIVADADLDATLERIGLSSVQNPISTSEPVANLCAAVVVDEPVNARIEWTLDMRTILESPTRQLATPADGACINNEGDPLENGVYEVFFTDDAGGESLVASFVVGATTRPQDFLNDTGADVCFVDVAPIDAGYYQTIEPLDPLADGDTITIELADVEQDARPVDCDLNELEAVFFTPSDDVVSLSSGLSIPPETPPPAQITDDELILVEGIIGSFDVAVDPGSAEEVALVDELIAPGPPLPIAAEGSSITLCSAWFTGGPFEGEAVWEFNGEFFNREPTDVADGVATSCIPPNGVAEFGEGAYQVHLERDGVSSTVQTYTVGRAQTQLGFVNDTGVEICAVGFSPTLTSFYTFYFFADAEDFGNALQPGESFTISAPFIENDIQARDCDDNVVAETLDIPPTDQTLNLSTGQP